MEEESSSNQIISEESTSSVSSINALMNSQTQSSMNSNQKKRKTAKTTKNSSKKTKKMNSNSQNEENKSKRTSLDSYFQPFHGAIKTEEGIEVIEKEELTQENNIVTLYRGHHSVEFDVPLSYEDLIDSACDSFDFPDGTIIEFYDLSGKIWRKEDFPSILNGDVKVLIVLDQNEEGKMTKESTLMVDITPNMNILLKSGTSEYDVASAIAEIVDNSIQATKGNGEGSKQVQIRVVGGDIYVWDNGVGMNADSLRKWGTMGVSQSDDESNQVPQNGTCSHRGFISRFGVGAKRAGFYLGNEILVMSKSENSNWATEMSLNKESLGNGEAWKSLLKLRQPQGKELKHKSWTLVKISMLNTPTFFSEEGIKRLGRRLAHIYYHYTHGTKDNEADIYTLKFNGNLLSTETGDLESQYETKGKNPLELEFQVKWKTPMAKVIVSDVRMKLMYYPFEEVETMPNPNESGGGNSSVLLRKPGVEVFWNDRLITDAYLLIDEFAFTKTTKISEKWLHRIHGKIFLNSDFPVTHSKMHILKENEAFEALKAYTERKIVNKFKEWVNESHTKYDKEISFIGEKYNKELNQTTCEGFKIGQENYMINDKVWIKNGRAFVLATLHAIWFSGNERKDDANGKFIPYSVTHIDNAEKEFIESIAKIRNKATDDEIKKFEREAKGKLPKVVKCFEGDGVDYPPSFINVGEPLKWVSAAIYDGKGKCIEGTKDLKDLKVRITLTIYLLHGKKKEQVFQQITDDFYKAGKVSFKNIKCFEKPGEYEMKFTGEYEGKETGTLKGEERIITVKPGEPHQYSVQLINQKHAENLFPVDSKLPDLVVSALDANGILASIEANHKIKIKCKINGKSSPLEKFSITQDQNEIVVKDLKLTKPSVSLSGEKAVITISPSDSKKVKILPASIEINVVPGTPATAEFSSNVLGEADQPFKIQNGAKLPEFGVIVKDEFGNIIGSPVKKSFLILAIEGKKKQIRKEISSEDGIILFESMKISGEVPEPYLRITAEINKKEKVDGIQLERKLIVIDRKSIPKFELLDNEGNVMNPEFDKEVYNYKIPVGSFISTCKFNLIVEEYDEDEVLDESSEVNATIIPSWAPDEQIAIKSKERKFNIPPIQAQKNAQLLTYYVDYLPAVGKEQKVKLRFNFEASNPSILSLKISKQSNEARIKCGRPTNWTVTFQDEYSNPIFPSKIATFDSTLLDPDRFMIDVSNSLQLKEFTLRPIDYSGKKEKAEALELEVSILGLGNGELLIKENSEFMSNSNIILKGSTKIGVVAGSATRLLINKVDNYKIECEEGQIMEESIINICDDYKNVQGGSQVEISLSIDGQEKLPFQFKKKKVVIDDGEYRMSGIRVTGSPGEYSICIKSTAVQLEPCFIQLVITENENAPKSIILLEEKNCLDKITVGSGNNLPILQFQLLNAKNQVISKKLEATNFILSWLGKTQSCNQFDYANRTFCFSDLPIGTKAGSHQLKVTYENLETTFDCEILPETPSKLFVSNWESTALSSPSQPIASNLEVLVTDEFENVCPIQMKKSKLEISIEPSEEQVSISLNGGASSSTVYVDVVDGRAIIEDLKLAKKIASSQYQLHLKLKDLSLDLPFIFNDEEKNRSAIEKNREESRTIRRKLEGLKEMYQKLRHTREKISSRADEEEVKFKTEATRIAHQYFAKDDPKFDVDRYISSETRISEMIEATQLRIDRCREPRPPKVPQNRILDEIRDTLSKKGRESGIIGIVSDLFFVDDEKISEVLAKFNAKRMNATIFENVQTFNHYHNKYRNAESFTCISLSNCDKRDPRRELVQPQGAPLDGFLGYVLHTIRLRPHHEYLRDTVAWSLFADTILFRNVPQGQIYRDWCKHNQKKCPLILTVEDCESIDARGWTAIGKSRTPQNPFSFGAYPDSEKSYYEAAKNSQLELLEKIRELKKNREKHSKEKGSTQTQMDKIREEINELEDKHKQFENQNQALSQKKVVAVKSSESPVK
eukprot:TRINITY_DN3833_c0_g2_i1.p1 TRINITY_DN3833_c0_g2~~TRINITY_DN3833_c0_g2_i1.p1  ORF type:complete len:1981 (-),score=726.02 TRINITY_DN3833_c0_g2_i1:3-5945(-)